MRHRAGTEPPVEPMDDDEQAREIRGLQEEGRRQSSRIRLFFSGICVVVGCCVGFSSFRLWWTPWDRRAIGNSSVLEEVSPLWALHLSYLGMLASIGLSWAISQGRRCTVVPALALAAAMLLAWGGVFVKEGITTPGLLWLPLGPAVAMGLGWFVFVEVEEIEGAAAKLDRVRYEFKKV